MLERDGALDNPSYVARMAGGKPTNQNVFPFSANLASLMTLEMLRMVVGDDWWPQHAGKLHFSYLPASLSGTDEQCRAHCEVTVRTALGDRAVYPFLEARSPARPSPPAFAGRFVARARDLLRRLSGRPRER